MKTATIRYQGELRTVMRHERSGQEVITDAPVDNHGKGEAFSPTDLLSSSLVSCMISIMGIRAMKGEMNMGHVTGSVVKVMAENPRRVAELKVEITFEGHQLNELQKEILLKAAHTCPVALSLHPDIKQEYTINW
jgi:putative redox protein